MNTNQTKWLPLGIFAVSLSSPSVLADIKTKIINGEEVTQGNWPFMVALVSKNMDAYKGHFCGASFIGDRYVLTAAHCIEAKSHEDVEVVIGVSDLSSPDTAKHRYAVEQIYAHESYSKEPVSNDIAIIELAQAPSESKVTLVDGYARGNLAVGQVLTVMGWGDQNPSEEEISQTSELHKVNVPLVDQDQCTQVPHDGYAEIGDDAFCAGYKEGGRDACSGDSGGPLMLPNNGKYEQLGIVSWGEGCAQPNAYGVYTNVSYFEDWIEQRTVGLNYRAKEVLGVRSLGLISHTFELTNNSDQEIEISKVSPSFVHNSPTTNNMSASITNNDCQTLSVGESCEVSVSYDLDSVGMHEFDVQVHTNSLLATYTPRAYVLGANAAQREVSDLVDFPNSGVYSTQKWTTIEASISSPVIEHDGSTALIVEGIPTGTVSMDLSVFAEEDHDILEIYINGFQVVQVPGEISGRVDLPMVRDADNSFMIMYKKGGLGAADNGKVTIENMTYTDELITNELNFTPAQEAEDSESSGGTIGWHWLIVLLVGLIARKRSLNHKGDR